MTMRNVPLAEAKAEAANLDRLIREHPHGCWECRPRDPCPGLRELRDDLREMCADIKSWFDPGPDQGTLPRLDG